MLLKSIFLDSLTVVFLLQSVFLNNFFSSLYISGWYGTCSKLLCLFIFTNVIQIEEKTHVPVIVRFPDYGFNENIHSVYWFYEWAVFLIHLFYDAHKNKELVSFESWEKKKLDCAIFGKICCVACAISRAGQLICLRNSLHERDVSLASQHLKARFSKTIVFIMGTIVHWTNWSSIFHWRNYSKINYNI